MPIGRRVAAALGVLVVALAFRAWRLESVPAGLYVDEVHAARNALTWRLDERVDLFGSRPLVSRGRSEVSHLYLAFASFVMAAGGDGLAGVRLVSVLPSLFCVLLVYLLGREVADRRVGMLAAFLLAASHWAARSGRTGWEQVLMTALQLAALVLLARGTRLERMRDGAGAGAAIGLSLYTYLAARLVLAHAVVWQAWEAIVAKQRRAALWRLALLVLVTAIVAGPFYLRMGDEPGRMQYRTRGLSVLNAEGPGEPWLSLGRSVVDHLLMFHVRGGAYARDAWPRFPMLDPLTGLLLLAGVVAVWRNGGWQRRLLVSWFAIAILGGVLSVSREGAPYPFRVGNLAPWACLVAALGGVWLWDRVLASRQRLGLAIAGAVLAAIVAINAWVLFVAGPAYAGNRYVYGVAPTAIGRWLAESRDGRPTVVHVDTLRPPPFRPFPHSFANRESYFRVADSVVALQLAAGLYAERPERALDPLALAGDVDVVRAIPPALPPGWLVIVAPGHAPAGATLIRLGDGTPVAAAYAITSTGNEAPRSPGGAQTDSRTPLRTPRR